MRIDSLGISPPFSPSFSRAAILETQKLSNTDWKTHFLVITSNLLIIIGVLLAFASVYIVTIVHPMIAVSSSVIPITIAAFLHPPQSDQNIKTRSSYLQGKIVPYEKGQPLGVKNVGANCWLIAFFQLLVNVPPYKKALNKASSIFSPLKNAIYQYEKERNKARNDTNKVSSVSAQSLREWLNTSSSFKVTPDKNEQIDAVDFLQFFLKQIDHRMPKTKEKVITNGRDDPAEGYRDCLGECTINISLGDSGKKDPTLQELLDNQFFYRSSRPKLFTQKETFCKFTAPPDDLTFCIEHTMKDYIFRSDDPVEPDIPPVFIPKQDQFNGNAIYVLDGMINHSGTDGNGHFISFVRSLGKWWMLDDGIPYLMDENKIKVATKKARILHYTRTE